MVGDLLGVFDGAAVLQVGGDAGRPEGMVADVLGQADGLARCLIIRQASLRCIGRGVRWRRRSMLRKRGVLFSPAMPAASR